MKLDDDYRTREHHHQKEQEPPFTIDLLNIPAAEEAKAKRENGFLDAELSVAKLDSIYDYLWLAGLPVPPQPLHYQLVLQREIVICEKMDMHLVCDHGRIFIKPIPLFLLSPAFWETSLQCAEGCDCFHSENYRQCKTKSQRTIALGFLFTYTVLISSQHDFRLAQQVHLLPDEREGTGVNWNSWQVFAEQILTSSSASIYEDIHRRFHYGELRANRLNAICLLTRQMYFLDQWSDYNRAAWLTTTTICFALALSAMQVGLMTERPDEGRTYIRVAHWFSVSAIIGVIVGGVLIASVTVLVELVNWRVQKMKARRRFKLIMGAVAEPRLQTTAARQGLAYHVSPRRR
ncbi:hypothetical protein ASPVEDRAFT_87828 [Aspergillus versicolor CBS 583.65]|uniref:Uncharacterized protein n=1 Tax=Aspergillus versicolor CBS 583.65 TaxID=1036611 RepID=A0A1L9PYD8_ASPVE|nr:uncharacterized protein ASPVEDRAFT_87828 [Aspergillus versicolor CBS 583.65]OJJ06528.1 hypothetical protein ASPVEDRAFT_87828 [Aspergillus versicolor CBS 583.65]